MKKNEKGDEWDFLIENVNPLDQTYIDKLPSLLISGSP